MHAPSITRRESLWIDSSSRSLNRGCRLHEAVRPAGAGRLLLEVRVRPTLELMLVELPERLCRRHDAASGLALISVSLYH